MVQEHSLSLKDGRLLAYHTFPEFEDDTSGSKRHPVLYFHGFPGCGVEAKCTSAKYVALNGGRVYAIDRPGMGKTSSPYPKSADEENNNPPETNLKLFVNNVWELVEQLQWTEFSIVGVSGGGPYALAMLASACGQQATKRKAKLVNVALVGAVCLAAGTDHMKADLIQMTELVAQVPISSYASWKLWMMAKSMGVLFYYAIPYLPESWIRSMIASGNRDSAAADQEWIQQNEGALMELIHIFPTIAAQGGVPGIVDDARICLAKHHDYEELLSKAYETSSDDLPMVGIFHGTEDRNVPIAHGRYMYETLFHSQAKKVEYEGMGHESTIMGKANEYASFVTTNTNTTPT